MTILFTRALIIDSACYLHSKAWMSTGSQTLPFDRDFLLPAPLTNYHGIVRSGLRYAIAYGMQNRVLSTLSVHGSHVFSFPVTQYWTPHSSRTFLHSATLLLDFSQTSENFIRLIERSGVSPIRSDSLQIHQKYATSSYSRIALAGHGLSR